MLTRKHLFHAKYLSPFFNSILILQSPSKSKGICCRSSLASVIGVGGGCEEMDESRIGILSGVQLLFCVSLKIFVCFCLCQIYLLFPQSH